MKNTKQTKNKISKKASMAVMGLAALGIVGVSGLGASALSSNNNGQASQDNLASRLATKFGLNKDDVAKEMDSYRQEEHSARESEMKSKLSEALQKKVDDGSITSEQKTAIENKLEERHKAREAERETNKRSGDKPSKEEMKTNRDAEKAEMDAWLKEQGINLDLKDVLPSRGGGPGHGPNKMEGGN